MGGFLNGPCKLFMGIGIFFLVVCIGMIIALYSIVPETFEIPDGEFSDNPNHEYTPVEHRYEQLKELELDAVNDQAEEFNAKHELTGSEAMASEDLENLKEQMKEYGYGEEIETAASDELGWAIEKEHVEAFEEDVETAHKLKAKEENIDLKHGKVTDMLAYTCGLSGVVGLGSPIGYGIYKYKQKKKNIRKEIERLQAELKTNDGKYPEQKDGQSSEEYLQKMREMKTALQTVKDAYKEAYGVEQQAAAQRRYSQFKEKFLKKHGADQAPPGLPSQRRRRRLATLQSILAEI